MTSKPKVCLAIEPDLVAAAMGEASPSATERVQAHVTGCRTCREDFAGYRTIDSTVGALRTATPPAGEIEAARARLMERLGDLRTRLLTYGVFPSPLGPILLARTEHGVSIVEYLDQESAAGSRKLRGADFQGRDDRTALEGLHRELLDFLAGRRTRLDWPLDMRMARSDFERAVLTATAAVPYGAVASYTGIAHDIGQPGSVRAVAQALRHNPVPIVVPCHRIVGVQGDLVGYAGHRTGLKQQLLTIEGVPTHSTGIYRRSMYHYDPNPDRQYCLPTCGDIARRPLGTVRLFSRRELAESTGLSPCLDCRPDLHPLVAV